jgi:hypothetical protein
VAHWHVPASVSCVIARLPPTALRAVHPPRHGVDDQTRNRIRAITATGGHAARQRVVGGVCTTGSKGTWLWLHGLVGRLGLPSRDYGHPLGARGRVACEPAAAGCWARASVLLVHFFSFFSPKKYMYVLYSFWDRRVCRCIPGIPCRSAPV